MIGVLFADIFYSKVIDDQQGKQIGGVLPKQGGMSNRGVPKFREVHPEVVVGDAASLLQPRHAFLGFHKNPAIRGERSELILGDDLLREHVQGHFHILVPLHRGIVVKIDNVQGHELGQGRGHRAVDQELSCRKARAGGGGDTGKVNFVTSNVDVYAMRFSLVRTDT